MQKDIVAATLIARFWYPPMMQGVALSVTCQQVCNVLFRSMVYTVGLSRIAGFLHIGKKIIPMLHHSSQSLACLECCVEAYRNQVDLSNQIVMKGTFIPRTQVLEDQALFQGCQVSVLTGIPVKSHDYDGTTASEMKIGIFVIFVTLKLAYALDLH